MNGIDMDGGIDWSSFKFPGEEPGPSSSSNVHSLLSPSHGTTSKIINTTGTMNDATAPLSQRGAYNVSDIQNSIGDATCRPSSENTRKDEEQTQTMLEMKRKLDHLEQTLADKDARLFDLESAMATVEAEASYQIQQSQVHLHQQLRACQDQLRQLEKDIDSKNQTIVKLKKRYRKEEPQANMQVNGETGVGTEMERFENAVSNSTGSNPLSLANDKSSAGKTMVRQIVVHDESEHAIPRNHDNDDDGGGGGVNGGNDDDDDDGDDLNQMCVVEPSPSASKTIPNIPRKRRIDNVQSYNNHKHSFILSDDRETIHVENGEYKCEDTTRVLLHLFYFLERYLVSDSKTESPILAPPCSKTTDDNHPKDNQWNHANNMNCKDSKHDELLLENQEESQAVVQIRNHLLCLLQYCSIRPEQYENGRQWQLLDETKSMVHLKMKNIVDIAFISKEIILRMVASVQEKSDKRNDTTSGCFLDSCFSISFLCLLKEFCIISSRGRNCICNWFCANSQQTIDIDAHDRGKAKNDTHALCRIRGLPEEFRRKAQTVHLQKQMCIGGRDRLCNIDSWWDDNFDIQCDLFQKSFFSCINGPNQEEYNALSYQQRARARSLQTIALECLCIILQDASNSQLVVLQDIIFNHKQNCSIGTRDIISVLEHDTIATMNGNGHRHALIKDDQLNQNDFSFRLDESESPDIELIQTKRIVLQLLSRFFVSTRVTDSVSEVIKSIYHHDSVSNLKRIVAALLDDLQAVIRPMLSSQDIIMDLEISILQFASDIFHVLLLVSNSVEGFDLVRMQMRYVMGANSNSSQYSPGSSCVAMGVDILELSTIKLLMIDPTCTIFSQKNVDVSTRRWLGLCQLVQTLVAFFYSIHSRCRVLSATSKSSTTKENLLFILLDTNRYHSFTDSCRKIASFPESCTRQGCRRTIDHSFQLKAKVLVQAMSNMQ